MLTAILDQVVHRLYHQAGVEHVHDHVLPDEVVISDTVKQSGHPKHPRSVTDRAINLITKTMKKTRGGKDENSHTRKEDCGHP